MPISNRFLTFVAFLALFLIVFLSDNSTFAQSSLGVGGGEQALPTGGVFEGFFGWIRAQQGAFNLVLNEYLVAIRNGESEMWGMVWICFLYGVLHAIGPGHGKVVISSYMVANEVQVKRGIFMSFASAFAQALTAIAVVGAFLFLLRGTGIKRDTLAFSLETASYVGVMFLGLWLLWRKLFASDSGHSHEHHDHDHAHHNGHDHGHHHDHAHHSHGDHDHAHHHHDHDMVCLECGHSHAPDPALLQGKFGMREVWTAIMAVGLRPCTGALLVMIFSFANALYLAGVIATLAMAVGTALTVSTLATMAVLTKNAALKLAGIQEQTAALYRGIEIAGALAIFLIGLVLFSALFAG